MLFSLPSQLSSNPGEWLKKPQLPLERLALSALLFFVVNMLNNWAFAFDISVPLHIILRSFGSVTTMVMGWAYGKRYTRVQVGAVVALTLGVVTSAWADASAKARQSIRVSSELALTLISGQDIIEPTRRARQRQ